ncbi:helicase-associated domain-containing protein [Streptomyces endophytica]|uniref:Helicase-associated domain-containing protein n=1 Tax=Streptomyces endophytica TaxID=2991496 RepID=A0ABY6PDL5_9ACTN|nr:helicase-associated domain-containing protein [Streptomyces endophytica]UZJ31861.1 helicase-associated domain-containing protein [Streptomyces endophytica]
MADLLRAADWYRPLAVTRRPMAEGRAAHTLHEAAYLGLVAHGSLTPLGRALLNGPDALADPLGDLLPAPLEQAHFQADLTAVVPGRPSAALAGLLASAADRESEEHAVTWRFTPASVRRALDTGHSADTLLTELTGVSATGALPQPLHYLVRDAARRPRADAVLPAACCIRSDDETLVRETRRPPRTARPRPARHRPDRPGQRPPADRHPGRAARRGLCAGPGVRHRHDHRRTPPPHTARRPPPRPATRTPRFTSPGASWDGKQPQEAPVTGELTGGASGPDRRRTAPAAAGRRLLVLRAAPLRVR